MHARAAVELAPHLALAHEQKGLAALACDDSDQGAASLKDALSINPTSADAWEGLARTSRNNGDRRGRAWAAERGLLAAPDKLALYAHLFEATDQHSRDRKLAWALAPNQRTGGLRHIAALLWAEIANAAFSTNEFDTLAENGTKAVLCDPSYPAGHFNLATGFYYLGDYKKALTAARPALCSVPENTEVSHILGLSAFVIGDEQTGWSMWAERERKRGAILRHGLPPRRWSGETIGDGVLLICSEQGVGDEIMFLSCLPDVLERVERVIVECEARWLPLLSRSYPDVTFIENRPRVPSGSKLEADFSDIVRRLGVTDFVPSGDLPMMFRGDPDRPSSAGPFLLPDPDEKQAWASELARFGPPPYVGVCWRSGLLSTRLRSQFYPDPVELIQALPDGDHTLVNLQYSDARSDLERIDRQTGVTVHQPARIDQTRELDRVAALIASMDVVLSPSTTVLQLAANLGRPCIAMGKSTFQRTAHRDVLYGTVFPVLNPDEPYDGSLLAERTGRALRHFLDHDALPIGEGLAG